MGYFLQVNYTTLGHLLDRLSQRRAPLLPVVPIAFFPLSDFEKTDVPLCTRTNPKEIIGKKDDFKINACHIHEVFQGQKNITIDGFSENPNLLVRCATRSEKHPIDWSILTIEVYILLQMNLIHRVINFLVSNPRKPMTVGPVTSWSHWWSELSRRTWMVGNFCITFFKLLNIFYFSELSTAETDQNQQHDPDEDKQIENGGGDDEGMEWDDDGDGGAMGEDGGELIWKVKICSNKNLNSDIGPANEPETAIERTQEEMGEEVGRFRSDAVKF